MFLYSVGWKTKVQESILEFYMEKSSFPVFHTVGSCHFKQFNVVLICCVYINW